LPLSLLRNFKQTARRNSSFIAPFADAPASDPRDERFRHAAYLRVRFDGGCEWAARALDNDFVFLFFESWRAA